MARFGSAVLALLVASAGLATAVSAPAAAQTPVWIDLSEVPSEPMILG